MPPPRDRPVDSAAETSNTRHRKQGRQPTKRRQPLQEGRGCIETADHTAVGQDDQQLFAESIAFQIGESFGNPIPLGPVGKVEPLLRIEAV